MNQRNRNAQKNLQKQMYANHSNWFHAKLMRVIKHEINLIALNLWFIYHPFMHASCIYIKFTNAQSSLHTNSMPEM